MKLKIYQVDAFTDQLFGGNPAAVVPLQQWLPDELMQRIAAENNLAETAFFVPGEKGFHLRWFTPAVEMPLCGHATLASAHVLFQHLNFSAEEILFETKSGTLCVKKNDEWITMNFPMDIADEIETPALMYDVLNTKPVATLRGKTKFLVVLHSQKEVEELKPDFKLMKQLPLQGVIATAKGNDVDFVSRFFAPNVGIDEDPVTGSAHCVLTPYWANELKKNEMTARQVSARGGYLKCKVANDRVEMSGKAVTFLEGEIVIPV